ncbi:DinB family protein [Hymenobacter nivis]|uniref:DinB family protein n=2 Tax=Hymenobacter nivis TaxID=1850093 RepID=A0A502GLR3_9BACT|nr:DinB family protein [Hymenobacter nivis]
MHTTRPEAGDFAAFYENYVALVPAGHDPLAALRAQSAEVLATFGALTEAQALTAYAPGKWTPKQVLLHLADAERVFTYRALRFARADDQPLAGFDENAYADASEANARPMSDLLAEYAATRAATLALFAGFTDAQLGRRGTANGAAVTVRALLFIVPGHERHHLQVFRERYAPVLHP